MKNRLFAVVLLIAGFGIACGKHGGQSLTAPTGPAAPTPGGQPQATDGLKLNFVKACPAAQSFSASSQLNTLSFGQPTFNLKNLVTGFGGEQVKQLTAEGMAVKDQLDRLWTQGAFRTSAVTIPACVQNVPASHISLVISAVNGDLRNAIQIVKAIDPNLWPGSLLVLYEYTGGNNPITTNMSFVPGSTDHFSFVDITVNNRVDIGFKWQPYGMTERIDTVLNGSMMRTDGTTKQYSVQNNHIVGDMPF